MRSGLFQSGSKPCITWINFLDSYTEHISGTQPNLTNRILIDNQLYSSNRILEGWVKHFENLGQPSNHDFDESFFHQVNNDLKEMVSQSEDQPDTTLTEIPEEV